MIDSFLVPFGRQISKQQQQQQNLSSVALNYKYYNILCCQMYAWDSASFLARFDLGHFESPRFASARSIRGHAVGTSVCCARLEKGSCYGTLSGLILTLVLPWFQVFYWYLAHVWILVPYKLHEQRWNLAEARTLSFLPDLTPLAQTSAPFQLGQLGVCLLVPHVTTQSRANPNRNIFMRLTTSSSNAV